MDHEFRTATEAWPEDDLAIRAIDAPDSLAGLRFSGYGAVFDKLSEPMAGGPNGTFREVISRGAFDRTLVQRANSIKLFWNHDTNDVLASIKSGTMRAEPDDRGVLVTASLPDTSIGRHKADLVTRGIADSMSFGFIPIKDEWSPDGKTRTLTEVRAFEFSIVASWPAYTATTASVRSLAAELDADPDELAEAFRVLRDPEALLTDDQVRLLTSAINARGGRRVTAASLADYRARFAGREFVA